MTVVEMRLTVDCPLPEEGFGPTIDGIMDAIKKIDAVEDHYITDIWED